MGRAQETEGGMKLAHGLALLAVALASPSAAHAWSPLRAENPNVKKGNALMEQERYAEALEVYDSAARELPAARGVQLNRGLALLEQDLSEQAKEAFLAAADPSASSDVRADAYYDLGVAYAREGDALSEQEEHEEASAHFREAADAFKRALRVRPGDRDAAWNLEYALQRIQEEEQKQQQQEQQEQDQEQQQQERQQQDQEQRQEEEEGQEQEGQQEQGDEPQQEQEDQQGTEEPQPQPEQQEQEGNSGGDRQEDSQPMARDDVERFLDALEQNERNLPLERARRRNAGRRPPEKDW